MSIVDKVIAAVTPPESDEARAEARQKARAAARPGDWLSQILDHHLLIEDAFAKAKTGTNASERLAALKELGVVLTGHAQAEEITIYTELAGDGGQKGHAAMGYDEQALTKVQMGALEKLDPMSQDWLDKLGHIEGAVKHHVYQEEGTWYPELAEELPAADQARLTERYVEEWERYTGGEKRVRQPPGFFHPGLIAACAAKKQEGSSECRSRIRSGRICRSRMSAVKRSARSIISMATALS